MYPRRARGASDGLYSEIAVNTSMYSVPQETLQPLSGRVLLAYARYLGIDPETEPSLLNVAREALTDPLPLGWERHLDEAYNMPFFYNTEGGFTSWQHPQLSLYLSKIDALRRPQRPPTDFAGGGQPPHGVQPQPQPQSHSQYHPLHPQLLQQGASTSARRHARETRAAHATPPRAVHEWCQPLPTHNPAPRPASSSSGGASAAICGHGSVGSGSVAGGEQASWEERWRRQQQEMQQGQLQQWQQWKVAPKVVETQAAARPLYGESWEKACPAR